MNLNSTSFRTVLLTDDVKTIFHTQFAGIFIMCIHNKFHIPDVISKWQDGNFSRVQQCLKTTHEQTDFLKMLLKGSRYSPPVAAPLQSSVCTGDALRPTCVAPRLFRKILLSVCEVNLFFFFHVESRVTLAVSTLLDLVSMAIEFCLQGTSQVQYFPSILPRLNPVEYFTYYQRILIFCSICAIVAALSAPSFLNRSVDKYDGM
jgi:hypothetical protein